MVDADEFVKIEMDLIRENENIADNNKNYFKKRNILCYELMGNISAGKTSSFALLMIFGKSRFSD